MMLNRTEQRLRSAALITASALGLAWNTNAATLRVPATYPSIQSAVNAARPGDTILVAAGSYAEAQIVIDKAVTVSGAGADVTVIDGGSVSDLEAPGLVRITAGGGNVVFSGFTLQNAGDCDGLRVGMYVRSAEGNKCMITKNRILGANDPSDSDLGLYAYGGWENLVFQLNTVAGTGANAVLIELHPGPTDVSYNVLDVGVWGADAIFTMTYGGVDVTTVQRRDNNLIDVGTGGPFDAAHRASGITFASAYRNPPYDLNLGEGKFTSVQIMRNVIYNIQEQRRGISLWNGDIDDNPSGGNIVAPQVVGNILCGLGRTGENSKGIQVLGLVTGAKLVNNDLAALEVGIHLRGWFGFAPRATKVISNSYRNVGTLVSVDPEAAGTKVHATHLVAP